MSTSNIDIIINSGFEGRGDNSSLEIIPRNIRRTNKSSIMYVWGTNGSGTLGLGNS